jgi:hypothetical protein
MTNCSCITGDYNFYVDSLDKDTIVYQDLSNWMVEDGYDVPEQYIVEITPPATSKSYSINIKTGQLNRLTEKEIGTLKDGIYCFKVTSCGQDYTRSKAIFPKLECCISQLWATLDSNKYDQINEIESHLKLVEINAELNNIQLAQSELKITKKLLENLKCDCDC